MSTMEQALRDEIAWHGKMLQHHIEAGNVGLAFDYNARLAALTAALPAPGVEAPGDYGAGFRAGIEAAANVALLREDGMAVWPDGIEIADAIRAMEVPAAPSAPAEISQAQAQAMREALRNLLMEAGYMAGQLAHRGLPGVPGDSVDRALNAARAALTPEPPR